MNFLIRQSTKKTNLNNKGFSLVEILCAVAILSLVTTTIAIIVIFSGRTYNKGVGETALQQEVQLVTNQIADLVRGAWNVTFDTTTDVLDIYENDVKGHRITFDKTDKTLVYQRLNGDGSVVDTIPIVLAENVEKFYVDLTDFAVSRIVNIELIITKDGKQYRSYYTMNSRNEELMPIEGDKSLSSPARVRYKEGVVLEPGQNYTLVIEQTNTGGLKLTNDTSKYNISDLDINEDKTKIDIQVSSNVRDSMIEIPWESKSDPDNIKGTFVFKIRRANSLQLAYTKDNDNVYIESIVEAYNYMPTLLEVASDETQYKYFDPRAVSYTVKLRDVATGATYNEGTNQFKNVLEEVIVNSSRTKKYKRLDKTKDYQLEVIAKSAHQSGISNRSGSAYSPELTQTIWIPLPKDEGLDNSKADLNSLSFIFEPGEKRTLTISHADINYITYNEKKLNGSGFNITDKVLGETEDKLTVLIDKDIATDRITLPFYYMKDGKREDSQIVFKIRRVVKVNLTSDIEEGTDSDIVTVKANVTVDNNEKINDSDKYYNLTKAVIWSEAELFEYDAEKSKLGKKVSDDVKKLIISDTTSTDYEKQFTIDRIEVEQDYAIRISAKSKHQQGKYNGTQTNRSGEKYGVVKGGKVVDEDIKDTIIIPILYRPLTEIAGAEITMEPMQTEDVDCVLNLKRDDVVELKLRYATYDGKAKQTVSSGTTAKFDRNKGKITITVGKNEKGFDLGYNSDKVKEEYDYTFYVDFYLNGKLKPKNMVIVHICRVDTVSVGVDYNPYDNPGTEDATVMDEISYHFKTRFNSGDGTKDIDAMKYLVGDKEKGRRALAVKYEWSMLGDYDTDGDGKVDTTKEVVTNKCILFYSYSNGTKAEILHASPEKMGVPMSSAEIKAMRETAYYRITDVGCAKWNSDGTVSDPQLKIHLKRETSSNKWPENFRIYFKTTALHPAGIAFSFDGKTPGYIDKPVTAEVTIYLRNAELDAPNITVVEPNQGTDDKNAIKNQARMELSVGHSAVYKIVTNKKDEVTLSGTSDPNTRTAKYNKTNNIPGTDFNPNKIENANSNQNDNGQDAEWTWKLGIIVGKDEHGRNGKGLITVDSLVSLNTRNKVISKVDHDVYFAIRRVDNLTLKSSDGATTIDKKNKAGQTITLDAKPTGCDGTKYYAKQEGENDYKSPYEMLWTIDVNGKTYDLNQKQSNDYIDVNSIKIETNASSGKQSITFKLKKALPKGTEIKATSLHAKGMYNSVAYNKSGVGYGNIYARIIVESDATGSGDGPNEYYINPSTFNRGSPYNFNEHGYTAMDGNAIKQKYASMYPWSTTGMEFHYYFRFREQGGTWTQYFRCMNEGNTWIMDELESQLFLPDKEYEIEYVGVLTSVTTNPMMNKTIYTIMWPCNDYLIKQTGVTTGFESYTVMPQWDSTAENPWANTNPWANGAWGNMGNPWGTSGNWSTNMTKMSEFCYRFTLGCAGVDFAQNSKLSIAEGSSNAGSKQYPLVVTGDFEYTLNGIYLNFGEKSGVTKYKDELSVGIEKLSGNNWVSVDFSTTPYTLKQKDNATFKYQYRASSGESGTYRIATYLNSQFFKVLTGTKGYPVTDTVKSHVTSSTRTKYNLSYPNYDIGYIYLKKN